MKIDAKTLTKLRKKLIISPKEKFRKVVIPPPDKAVTQRAILIGLITGGVTILNPSLCGDCVSALDCAESLGARVKFTNDSIKITNEPLKNLKNNSEIIMLNAGNSATTARLLMGLTAGFGIKAQINGDISLKRRSMKPLIKALESMGARLSSTRQKCPIENIPAQLNGIDFSPATPSAQIKSAVMLAALNARGETTVREPIKTRDHTEIMLKNFGFNIKYGNDFDDFAKISPKNKDLTPNPVIKVAGDISSAAFLIAAALLVNDGHVLVREVGINPTRMGMIDLLKSAGADINIERIGNFNGESVGNITVNASKNPLNAFELDALTNHSLIDEIPILAVIAAFCAGTSVFKNLSVLKNKESNRMRETYRYLQKFGANATLTDDTLTIVGDGFKEEIVTASGTTKKAPRVSIRSKDHRIIMAFSVAGLISRGCSVEYPQHVKVSYPEFFSALLD